MSSPEEREELMLRRRSGVKLKPKKSLQMLHISPRNFMTNFLQTSPSLRLSPLPLYQIGLRLWALWPGREFKNF